MKPSIVAGPALRGLAVNRDPIIERLRRGLLEAGLDCGCRDAAAGMLDRIGAEQDRARRAAGLGDARKMRDAIRLVLRLLDELDEIGIDEADPTAFNEIAGLFRDIGDFAVFGSAGALRAGGRDCR